MTVDNIRPKWFLLWFMLAFAFVLSLRLLTAQPLDGTAAVQKAKDDLHAIGVQTENAGPCGAFQIVNLAAQRLGAGVLYKPDGNHCEWPAGSGHFFSVDIVAFRNGQIFDALIASEVENRPAWQNAGLVDPTRYRDPVVSAPVPIPDVPPGPGTTCPPADTNVLLARLAVLEGKLDALAAKPAPVFPIYRTSLWGSAVVLRPDPAVK